MVNNMKKLVALVLTFLFLLTGCSKVEVTKIEDDIKTDAIRFYEDYKKVGKKNIYEYETFDNILDIMNNKSGIIYLGFPSCALCKEITPILNEAAKEKNISKISYYDFKNIRDNYTFEYEKIIKKLSTFLDEDDEGNKRLTAPSVIFVNEGEIVGYYKGVLGSSSEELLTIEEKQKLKEEFLNFIDKVLEEKQTTKDDNTN